MGRSVSDGVEVVFIFFLLSVEISQRCLCENLTKSCIDQERQALLKFKDSFENYTSHYFDSWEGKHCCKWKGVKCDGVTGHVIKIDLSNGSWIGLGPYYGVAKAVSPSLLELKHLNYLDLSFINFQFSPIPSFIGSMKKLRYLNLSNCLFSGRVPHQLGNLTNLQILDLSTYEPQLYMDDFTWFSQLSSLKYIDMSGVYMNEGNTLMMQEIYKLPFLLQAHLMYCGIDHLTNSHGYVNSFTLSSKVQVLNLRGNGLSGLIPEALQNMTDIRVLDLSENHLDSIPLWLGEFRNLVHLDLARNRLSGLFPIALQNMSSLRFLDLSYNSLTSSVPVWLIKRIHHVNLAHNKFSSLQSSPPWDSKNNCDHALLDLPDNKFLGETFGSFKNLSVCVTTSNYIQALDLSHNELNDHMESLWQLENLMYLSLASNSFYGLIPLSFGKLTKLRELVLGDNQLSGTIPASLGRLSTLRVLNLSGNHLNGIIPFSLGKLVNLKTLDLSSNFLEGALEEIHLGNLSYLQELRIGMNKLFVKLAPNWLPPFQLTSLQLQSCKIETQFPQWLQTQNNLINLDLSNTGIWGTFPTGFQQKDLIELELSNNKISGPLPRNLHDVMPNLNSLFLSNSLLNGSIPKSLCKLQRLQNLDLSKNKLSSEIPDCLGYNNLMELIDLSSNELSGTIPKSFCISDSVLQSLNLSNNSLHGGLPLYLGLCYNMVILDIGNNQLSGVIPSSIAEELFSLQVLRLRQNMFNGSIPLSLCRLYKLQILDLASNNLIGTIPFCISNLSGMVLYQSLEEENETVAPTYAIEAPAIAIEALSPSPSTGVAFAPDFNQWDKEDVKQILKGREFDYTRNLKFVVNMDLSNNKLVGLIPEVITSLTRLVSLNLSRNYLSGAIPNKIGKMRLLESLDFSWNQLAGPLPSSMSSLTSLSHLNLSYNNFSGAIPEGNQFFTLEDPSIYVGNPLLCGEPVLKRCHGNDNHEAPTGIHYEDNLSNKDEKEKIMFYFVVALGFMTGFWGVIGVLVFHKSLRYACFRYVEKIGDKIYVAAAIRIARHRRMG